MWKPQKDDYRVRGIDPDPCTVLRSAGGPVTTTDTVIAEGVAAAHPQLIRLSRDLYDHPEIAWEEVRSSRRVAEQLSDNGFAVTSSYCGLDTAFAARIGSGELHSRCAPNTTHCPGSDTHAATT